MIDKDKLKIGLPSFVLSTTYEILFYLDQLAAVDICFLCVCVCMFFAVRLKYSMIGVIS